MASVCGAARPSEIFGEGVSVDGVARFGQQSIVIDQVQGRSYGGDLIAQGLGHAQ